jgi:hypothetical protein
MNPGKIAGGYYLKARRIQESWIAHAPPHVREIWDWLLLNANWADSGICKRGQLLTSYKEIQEGLHWMVGWRKQRYTKNDCETSMNLLKNHTMVTTQKTTRGMFVTILNFDKYQDPKNYEAYNESYRKHTRGIQTADTILEEEEEEVRKKLKDSVLQDTENDFEEFWTAYPARGVPAKKQKKELAKARWMSLYRAKKLPDLQRVIQCLKDDMASKQWSNPEYIPLATTWLNSKPWKDGREETPSSGSALLDQATREFRNAN